jgi:hypothetical protein
LLYAPRSTELVLSRRTRFENDWLRGSEGAGNDSAVLSAGSPDRFGYEWHAYQDLRPEHVEQFRGWTAHLAPTEWRKLTFLDVGCGMGRNSYWPMLYSAAGGLAIDVDDRSPAAAKRTLAPFPLCGSRNGAPTISAARTLSRPWSSRLASFIICSTPSGRSPAW